LRHIGRPVPTRAERTKPAILQKPQQRHLSAGCERVDLVEEQRPALCLLNQSGLRLAGVVYAPRSWPEELVLDEVFRQRAAIHG